MKHYILYPLRGAFNFTGLAIMTALTAVLIFLVAPFVWIIPHKKYHQAATRFIQRLPIFWVGGIKFILNLTMKSKFDVQGPTHLQKNKPYILVSNHRSWIDILLLGYAFHGKVPSLRFFMKKELLWTLPFGGLAAWLLGYPFMERHTSAQFRKNPALKNKDIETTKKACRRFVLYPATVMNYIEGTRFTEKKKIAKGSPYQHLLKPKAGGIAIVLNEMRDHLAGFIDATIAYQPDTVSFWEFCCGNFKTAFCHYRVLPIEKNMRGDYTNDRSFRIEFQQWLNRLWEEKDQQLDRLLKKKP